MKCVIEEEEYLIDELETSFDISLKEINELINKGIIWFDNKKNYSFKYVGLIIFNNKALFCLPKYIEKNIDNSNELVRIVFKLLRTYKKREKLVVEELATFDDIDLGSEFNLITSAIFLIDDYFENGLYTNEKQIYSLNGDNEINWTKTIDDIPPFINQETPIYFDYYTNDLYVDENNYFRQLHKYILNACSSKLDSLGIANLFMISNVFFDVEEEILGSKAYITNKIDAEIREQFISRKQILLRVMAAFVNNDGSSIDNNKINVYGTRFFNIIWEKVCGYILENKYEEIKSYIDKPIWETKSGYKYSKETLRPDIINVWEETLFIFDAKYYKLTLNEDTLLGNPGIEDITKQYLYQMALEKYQREKLLEKSRNILLFPSNDKSLMQIGKVSIDFLKKYNPGDIELYYLPANKVYNMYINGEKLNNSKLVFKI